jgi:hypothetical protein
MGAEHVAEVTTDQGDEGIIAQSRGGNQESEGERRLVETVPQVDKSKILTEVVAGVGADDSTVAAKGVRILARLVKQLGEMPSLR